jgi:hypothetical protein
MSEVAIDGPLLHARRSSGSRMAAVKPDVRRIR